ncbi:hypothetical protein KSD_00530 [Ktedonobacter sp. SOSP1-85]|uniref:ISKra4 family transposase n=1 Tax=Ktedonobacter sp. SOSP1-85 TaxID=2778367 RepID=UPI001916B9D5|nr:ISKra4 family transposase [Ktedonobacter sp. SOSP1-85]GHO72282.1 hypothetical protein KSD_00530 [Ktedonobacter sp. SOSP1-85]
MLETLLGVRTTKETARSLTERMGACMEAAHMAEGDTPSPPTTDQPAPQRYVLSADGAMISLVNKQWAEVRTLAIGEPHVGPGADGEPEIHVGHLSYVSRLCDAFTFLQHVAGEIQRRKVLEARDVCSITDGAEWCQRLTASYRPDALRILDFPHAAEHLSQLLEALEHAGLRFPDRMLSRCLHVLKHRGPRALLRMSGHLENDLTQQKGIGEHLDYLRKREALMQYPVFRTQGWPIGSGMVESANKLVVQARLKGSGMHWERGNVNPLLTLRMAVCNDRWQEMWQKAIRQQRMGDVRQRSALDEPEVQASHQGTSSPSVPALPLVATSRPRALPSEPPSHAEAATPPPLTPLPPVDPILPPPSPRPLAHPQVPVVPQQSDTCPCGMPLIRFKGHRTKEYCSHRCRQRAYCQRQAMKHWGQWRLIVSS